MKSNKQKKLYSQGRARTLHKPTILTLGYMGNKSGPLQNPYELADTFSE
jgi:hypothetical protein